MSEPEEHGPHTHWCTTYYTAPRASLGPAPEAWPAVAALGLVLGFAFGVFLATWGEPDLRGAAVAWLSTDTDQCFAPMIEEGPHP